MKVTLASYGSPHGEAVRAPKYIFSGIEKGKGKGNKGEEKKKGEEKRERKGRKDSIIIYIPNMNLAVVNWNLIDIINWNLVVNWNLACKLESRYKLNGISVV